MKHIYMLSGPWKDIPGGDEPYLRVVHPGKKRAPPGPPSQQVMLVTPDHKGKAQQKQRSGCSLEHVTHNALIEQDFYYQALATCACYSSCLPIQRVQLHPPPSAGVIQQRGPAASDPGQQGQTMAVVEVLSPGQTPRALLVIRTSAHQLLHHHESKRWFPSRCLQSQPHPPDCQEV